MWLVTKKQILLFVALFILLAQTLLVLDFIPVLDALLSGLRVILFAVLFVFFFVRYFYVTKLEYFLLTYALFLGAVSVMLSDNVIPFVFQVVNVTTLLILFKYFEFRDVIRCSALILSLFVYLNCLLTIFYPDAHFYLDGKPTYLLGYNYNSMGSVLLVAIVVNAMCVFYDNSFRINMIVLSVASFITVFFMGSMTSSVGIALLIAYIVVARMKGARFLLKAFLVCVLLFSVGIVFMQMEIQNEFIVWFIEDVLDKDLTFTDRARIWLEALALIFDSPWVGYGVRDVEWFNHHFDVLTAHNFVLTMLLKGGVILLTIFIAIVGVAVKSANQNKTPVVNVLQFGCCSLLLMMTMETYSMLLIFFLVFLNYFSNTLYLEETTDHVCEA